jgi:hypothetical protein
MSAHLTVWAPTPAIRSGPPSTLGATEALHRTHFAAQSASPQIGSMEPDARRQG